MLIGFRNRLNYEECKEYEENIQFVTLNEENVIFNYHFKL